MTLSDLGYLKRAAAIVGLFLVGSTLSLYAQDIMFPSDDYTPTLKKRKPKQDVLPDAPGLAPTASIPMAPLGFGPPGVTYLGRNYSLVSLDFLDEDRLLFSFRAPGLRERGENDTNQDRQMKAIVLNAKSGKVEADAIWTLPDRGRYLWILRDGRFLLRSRDGLSVGDASLHMDPLAAISGQFVSLQVSPARTVALLDTLEKPSGSAPTATAQRVARLIQLDPGPDLGKAQQIARPQAPSLLPINSDGYLETIHIQKIDQWLLRLDSFAGAQRILGQIESTCLPTPAFLSERQILVAGCNLAHVPKLTSYSTSAVQSWEMETPATAVPPLLSPAADGSRFARETMVLWKPIKRGQQVLWVKAVKGQAVRVLDSATGNLVFETPVSPVLDAGGNAAISPSGRRLAVLSDGAIKVFDLPADRSGR